MADKKISDLGDGGAPQDPDDFVVARGGTNVKLAWSSLSAVAASNQIAVTVDGNTAGVLAPMTSGTVTLAGGNNITLSQIGNAVTISGPNAGGAQTGISSIGNSETTYSSGAIELVNTGAITIASNAGQQFVFSVDPQSVQPETQTFIGGISASDTAYTSGTVRITGVGGGVTVSSNTGQRIDISVAAQSVQPETQTFVAGISASDTLYTSGNVRLTGVGGGVTISSNTGQRVDISVAAQSVQPETQTFIAGVSASDTLYTSGNVRITGVGGGITVSSNTGQRIDLSVAAQSVQPETQTFIGGISASNTLYTSGSVRFTGSGAVTVRSGTGQLVVIDSPTQTTQVETQTFVGGIANSQTTYTSGTVGISELGAVTFRSTTGNQYQISVNSQTVQTQGGFVSLGVSTGGNSSGNTQVSTGSRFVLVASGNLTASQATAAGASTVTLSVAAQTVQTQNMVAVSATNTLYSSGTVLFTGSNMITVKSSGAGQTIILDATQTVQTQSNIAALYDGANSISTGTVRVTNANGVSFSVNAQTLSASVNESISMFAVSNTTQNTSGTAHKSALSFGGAGIASVGVTGGSVVISVPSGGGAGDGGVFAGASTMGNTAGSTGTVSTGNFVLVGTGPISLSQSTGAAGSAATISINAPATSSLSGTGGIQISTNGSTISVGYSPSIADWENIPMGNAALATHVSAISKTPIYWNDEIPGRLVAKSLALKISMVTASQPLSVSVHLGVYTLVNSTSAALLGSHSEAFHVSSASSVSLSGVRNLIMTGIGTHATLSTIGQGEYMLGLMFSATATNAMNFSLYGAASAGGPLGGIYPGTNNLSTGTSQGIQALAGRGSTTVNAMPANVQASELVNYGAGASMQLHPWIYIRS